MVCQAPHEWTTETARALASDKIIFGVAIVMMLLYVSFVYVWHLPPPSALRPCSLTTNPASRLGSALQCMLGTPRACMRGTPCLVPMRRLGQFHRVAGRQLLSISVVATVGLSLGFGFGVAGFAGLRTTQLSLLAIFVLLGVGVDDMFLVVDAFDRHADVGDLPKRTATALAEIGSSTMNSTSF